MDIHFLSLREIKRFTCKSILLFDVLTFISRYCVTKLLNAEKFKVCSHSRTSGRNSQHCCGSFPLPLPSESTVYNHLLFHLLSHITPKRHKLPSLHRLLLSPLSFTFLPLKRRRTQGTMIDNDIPMM